MRRTLPLCILTLALAVACGREPAEEPADDADATGQTDGAPVEGTEPDGAADAGGGAAVFSANCATCHGEGGTGDGPAAIGLEPPPADLTDGQWTTGDGSLGAVENTIRNGSPGTAMIAWEGTLTDDQIRSVAEHVVQLGGR